MIFTNVIDVICESTEFTEEIDLSISDIACCKDMLDKLIDKESSKIDEHIFYYGSKIILRVVVSIEGDIEKELFNIWNNDCYVLAKKLRLGYKKYCNNACAVVIYKIRNNEHKKHIMIGPDTIIQDIPNYNIQNPLETKEIFICTQSFNINKFKVNTKDKKEFADNIEKIIQQERRKDPLINAISSIYIDSITISKFRNKTMHKRNRLEINIVSKLFISNHPILLDRWEKCINNIYNEILNMEASDRDIWIDANNCKCSL